MIAPAPIRPLWDWRRPHHWIAFGFGAGLSPLAPGTAGTLIAIPLYLVLQVLPPLGYLLVLAILFLVGLWACDKTARELSASDPGAIVWDEILGFLVTMALAPPGWIWILLGFILFRLFDILKPWPIGALDRRIKGGLGILLDDLVAGLMAWGILHLVLALSR
ncbi:MAG: phosphatidylglycerophosphatase A [Chromatiaceae bacterium]